jgi:hypothetical protein
VTVLTSSTADKLSREDEKWQHGAFTKVLLDALSGSAHAIDTDHNGVITMAELTDCEALVAIDQRRTTTRARSAFPWRQLCCRVVRPVALLGSDEHQQSRLSCQDRGAIAADCPCRGRWL